MLGPDVEDFMDMTAPQDLCVPVIVRDAVDVESILGEIQNICERLEETGDDVLVLYTRADVILGTTTGTSFVKPGSTIVSRFHQFCKDQKDSNNIISIAPLECTESPSANTENLDKMEAHEFINATNSDALSLFDAYNEDTNDYDNIIIPNSNNTEAETVEEVNKREQEIQTTQEKVKVAEEPKRKKRKAKKKMEDPEEFTAVKKWAKEFSAKQSAELKQQLLSVFEIDLENTTKQKDNKVDDIAENDSSEKVSIANQSEEIEENEEVASTPDICTRPLEESERKKIEGFEVVSFKDANVKEDQTNIESECFKCEKMLSTLGRLREHMTKVHKMKIGYLCTCGKFFQSTDLYEKHKSNKAFKFTCSECKGVFQTDTILREHIESMHGPGGTGSETTGWGKFPCLTCSLVLKHKHHLALHNDKVKDCDQINDPGTDEEKIGTSVVTYTDAKTDTEIQTTYKKITEAQKKNPWKCVVCTDKKIFHTRSNFLRHMLIHIDVGNFRCEICNSRFKSPENLKRHRDDHDLRPYRCLKCPRVCERESELQTHMKYRCRSGDREIYKCETCGLKLKNMLLYQKHKNSHAGIKPYKCEICSKYVVSKESLERHMISLHQFETHFKCTICHKEFKTKDNFKKHQKTHEEPKFHCDICGKGCVEMGNLKKHMMSHTKEKPFVCEQCGKAYGRKALLDNHIRVHTGEKPYTCTVQGCVKGFRSYANMKQHIRSHATTHAYVCDVCGRSFKQPGRLSHHRKDHFVDWRWPCAYCEEKFKSLFMYKGHLAKKHPDMKKDIEDRFNIRIYSCDICPKMYGDRDDLIRHINIHKGIKPYKCQYCNKAFNDKSNLKQHEKIHTGDKPFKCTICEKAFIHKKTLRLHGNTCQTNKPLKKKREPKVKLESFADTILSDSMIAGGTGMDLGLDMKHQPNVQQVYMGLQPSLDHANMITHDPDMLLQPHVMFNTNTNTSQPQFTSQNIPIAAVNSVTGQIEPLYIIENFGTC